MADPHVERVFCASPGDLKVERDSFRRCIDEYNRLWSEQFSIRFEPVMWEYNTRSGISGDPQSVISQQIGKEYGLFVGLMWTRFGTATPRAKSGTAEELGDAIKRWRENVEDVEIMFFFKDKPVHISSLDAEQVYNVLKFKEELGKQGILFHHFDGDDKRNFEEVFRQSLTLYAKDKKKLLKRGSLNNSGEFMYAGEVRRTLNEP